MRLSTNMMYELGMRGVQRPQTEQLQLQQQISAGRRVVKPSDDPIAAAGIVGLNQAKSVNTQYGLNAENAQSSLQLEVDALGDATRVLQDVKTLIVKAGNPGLQNQDRASIATEVEGLYNELLGIANRTDGNGQYLFSGFQASTQPFAETTPGVVAFSGDEGQRLVQIGPQRRIAVGDSGVEVFQRAREGNGSFVPEPVPTNTGGGMVGPGIVRNAQAWNNPANSRDYTIQFHVSGATPPVTTYDIVDSTNNVSMLTGAAPAAGPYARVYKPGVAIDLQRQAGDPIATPFDAGIQVDISGAPLSGDKFTVRPADTKDVFSTVHDLVTRLKNGVALGEAPKAIYQSGLNATSASLDRGLDQILTTRSAVGIRMQELDNVKLTTEDMNLHYEEDLSRLQDLDYAQALSTLAQKQFSLEAAQKSFVTVTSLKLFDFLR
jgi:flagellar hook-associated protein 3 FlgL